MKNKTNQIERITKMTNTEHNRESIQNMPGWKRPSVRCRFNYVNTLEDGTQQHGIRECAGHIIIDGNNPWVVTKQGGEIQETRISWELLLEVINNPLSPPVFMESVVEYAA